MPPLWSGSRSHFLPLRGLHPRTDTKWKGYRGHNRWWTVFQEFRTCLFSVLYPIRTKSIPHALLFPNCLIDFRTSPTISRSFKGSGLVSTSACSTLRSAVTSSLLETVWQSDTVSVVASGVFGEWGCKPHTPGAVSVLAFDQLQWQRAPVPFSQQADCCSRFLRPHCPKLVRVFRDGSRVKRNFKAATSKNNRL